MRTIVIFVNRSNAENGENVGARNSKVAVQFGGFNSANFVPCFSQGPAEGSKFVHIFMLNFDTANSNDDLVVCCLFIVRCSCCV